VKYAGSQRSLSPSASGPLASPKRPPSPSAREQPGQQRRQLWVSRYIGCALRDALLIVLTYLFAAF
jgi:hypothetical protein